MNFLTLITSNAWDLSSAGRASALQAEGHRFEPYRSHFTSLLVVCRRGGTGRRAGLKILLWWHSTGSIPVAGIHIRHLTEHSVSVITDVKQRNLPNEYVCVAQLDRALGYGPRCRGFESSRARTERAEIKIFLLFLLIITIEIRA